MISEWFSFVYVYGVDSIDDRDNESIWDCQSIDCYGRQCFYRITIAFDLCAYGSHASHKNVDSHRNINGQHRQSNTCWNFSHAVVSHTPMPCPGYWRTIKCCHRMKSITTVNIWDTWNNTPPVSFVPKSILRFAWDASNIIIAIVTDDGFCHNFIIMNTNKKRQQQTKKDRNHESMFTLFYWVELLQPVAASSPSTATIIIIFYLSTNKKNKIITICIKMGRKWFN